MQAQRDDMFREHALMLEAQLAEYEVATRQLARLREVRLPLARQKVENRSLRPCSRRGANSSTCGLRKSRPKAGTQRLQRRRGAYCSPPPPRSLLR